MQFRHHFYQLAKGCHIYFSRLTRELAVILPAGLLILLVFNLLQPKSQFAISKDNVLQNSADSSVHLFLAQQLFATNQFKEAEKEALLAGNQQLLDEIKAVKSQPEEIRSEILWLRKIIDQYPNYRDAYLQLAIRNWQLYRPFEARKFLEKALEIDPNNQTAVQLKSFIVVPSE